MACEPGSQAADRDIWRNKQSFEHPIRPPKGMWAGEYPMWHMVSSPRLVRSLVRWSSMLRNGLLSFGGYIACLSFHSFLGHRNHPLMISHSIVHAGTSKMKSVSVSLLLTFKLLEEHWSPACV